ncbi:MAG: sodium:solute symporter [Candidatus Altiarchaeales archaeon]|nr:MAG: sodium:solute symporter [Candidatus Altiarchaeales archaeon]
MIQLIVVGVVLFFLIVICVGVYLSRLVKGRSENYIVANRQLILGVTAATLMAQSIDADITLGLANFSFLYGFWSGAAMIIGLSGALILIGLFFAEPLNEMKLLTPPDFYGRKYGRTMEIMVSSLMVFSSAIFVGGCLVAVGFIFQIFLGVSYWLGIFIVSVGILMYTVPGGLISVVNTDLIQLVMILLGVIALVVFMMTSGISIEISQEIFDTHQIINPGNGALINLAILLALGVGNIIAVDFVERVFAIDNPKTAKWAFYIAGIGTLLIGIPFIIIGIASINIFNTLNITVDPVNEPVLLTLLANVSPTVFSIPIILGILAAAVSTADGLIVAASSIISHNLLGYNPEDTNNHGDKLLFMSRLSTIPVAVLAMFFAMFIPVSGILIILSFDILLSGAVVPFILGLFWSKSNTPAAIVSFLSGSFTRLILFVLTPSFYGLSNDVMFIEGFFTSAFDGMPTIISPAVSLITFVLVALVTQKSHPPREII